ncbi:hypothetical protein Hanom_Chr16g01477281 [Helianthus anomalus]
MITGAARRNKLYSSMGIAFLSRPNDVKLVSDSTFSSSELTGSPGGGTTSGCVNSPSWVEIGSIAIVYSWALRR